MLIDPHRREKGSRKSLFTSMLFGFASIPLVILLYKVSPDLTSEVSSPLGQEFIYEMLVVGPAEEFGKLLIFFLIMVRRRPMPC